MGTLELRTYRYKKVIAYLVSLNPCSEFKPIQETMQYGKPKTEEDLELSYRQKEHDIEIELPSGCGYYKYKEYRQKRTVYGYFYLKDGEIDEEFASLEELKGWFIKNKLCKYALPELEGSAAQINYAEDVRSRFILLSFSDGCSFVDGSPSAEYIKNSNRSAKWWIESKDIRITTEMLTPYTE